MSNVTRREILEEIDGVRMYVLETIKQVSKAIGMMFVVTVIFGFAPLIILAVILDEIIKSLIKRVRQD